MKKRLSLLLAILMVFSMLPSSFIVYAEGMDNHIHSDDCYAVAGSLLCPFTESEGHIHSDDCFDSEGELICTIEKRKGHTHNEDCYAVGDELICDYCDEPIRGFGDKQIWGLGITNFGIEPLDSDEGVTTAEELYNAFDSADDGDTITLGANIAYSTNNDDTTIPVDKEITLLDNGVPCCGLSVQGQKFLGQ